MVKIIDRYLVRTFLLPLFYCLLAFVILFIAYDMSDKMEDFFDNQIHPNLVVRYYMYQVPIILSQTVPFATLLALLYCLGNLSRNNEIIAMRASGIALFRIVRPYLIIGLLLYFVTLGLSEAFVPKARRLSAQIVEVPSSLQDALIGHSHSKSIVFLNAPEDRMWSIGSIDVVSNCLKDVKVTEFTHSGKRRKKRIIEAQLAEYVEGFGWWMYDVTSIRFYPDGTPYPAKRNRKMSIPYYNETPHDIVSSRRARPDMMTILDIMRVMEHGKQDSDYHKKLRMEAAGRFATPAVCFVFVLLAAPFGIFHTRAGMVKGVITSILLCLAFYLVASLFISLGDKGHVAPLIAAWLPNIVFTAFGFYLLYRMR